MSQIAVDRLRQEFWTDYLNAGGLTRGALGYRVLEAYTAGYSRAEIAAMLHRSPGHVSKLATDGRNAKKFGYEYP